MWQDDEDGNDDGDEAAPAHVFKLPGFKIGASSGNDSSSNGASTEADAADQGANHFTAMELDPCWHT